jgi:hypothetical protein
MGTVPDGVRGGVMMMTRRGRLGEEGVKGEEHLSSSRTNIYLHSSKAYTARLVVLHMHVHVEQMQAAMERSR